jgi:hypothetical protein
MSPISHDDTYYRLPKYLLFLLNHPLFCEFKQTWLYVNNSTVHENMWAGLRSRYSDWLLPGLSGDRIPVVARISEPVETGP